MPRAAGAAMIEPDRAVVGEAVLSDILLPATAGEKTGYAYSDEITLAQLEQAADTARYIARSPAGEGSVPAIKVGRPTPEHHR